MCGIASCQRGGGATPDMRFSVTLGIYIGSPRAC